MSTVILRFHRCPLPVSCISIEESFLVSPGPKQQQSLLKQCHFTVYRGDSDHRSKSHIRRVKVATNVQFEVTPIASINLGFAELRALAR
jgi:hypothetical protein